MVGGTVCNIESLDPIEVGVVAGRWRVGGVEDGRMGGLVCWLVKVAGLGWVGGEVGEVLFFFWG